MSCLTGRLEVTFNQWARPFVNSGWLEEGGLFGRARDFMGDGGHFWQGDEGKYGVGERSGGVGSNIGGSGVFWVGLQRVRGADDQPSLSRSFYRDGLFGEIWG